MIVRDHFVCSLKESPHTDWLFNSGSWASWKHIETDMKLANQGKSHEGVEDANTMTGSVRHSSICESTHSSTTSSEVFDSVSNQGIETDSRNSIRLKPSYRLKLRLLDAFIFLLLFVSIYIFYKNLEIFIE